MSIATAAPHFPQEVWDNQVATMPESAADWIVPGFVARGNMTLLTSLWKAGKTTLLAHLLARRASGQPLFGLPVSPGKTVVITEEPRSLWADRCRQFNFGGNLCLFPQPFPHLPSAQEWSGLLERVGQLQRERGIDLLVIDSVTHFLRAENIAAGVLDLIMPVRAVTAGGMAALFMHHPRRQGAGRGIAGRGHGALHTEVDISIEMRHAGGNLDSRARRFFCMSRHTVTPRHFLFELNADGSDYTVLPTAVADDEGFGEHWEVLRGVLEDARQKLTRFDILDEWPDDFAKPHPVTLAKWLKVAVAAGLVQIEGTGRKADPYRYWMAATEERWRKENIMYDDLEHIQRVQNLPFISLREKKRMFAENGSSGDDWDGPVKSCEEQSPPDSEED
jgi:hypothetical protein